MGWLWVALLVLLAAALGWYFVRLNHISNRIGSFECSLMRGERWIEGYACYAVGRLDWYPILSIASRPALSWTRGDSDVVVVEHARDGGRSRVVIRDEHAEHALLMPVQAYSGLRSWLESAPPTTSTYR